MLDQYANLMPAQLGNPADINALFNLAFDNALAAVNTSVSGTLQSIQPGVPVAGQTVYAIDTVGGEQYATTTLNNGSFVLSSVPASMYTFSVQGLLLPSPPTETISLGQALYRSTAPGRGRLEFIRADHQHGDRGRHRRGHGCGHGRVRTSVTVTTDANGDYSVTGLPQDTYTLQVDATGFGRGVLTGVVLGHGHGLVNNLSLSTQGVIAGLANPQAWRADGKRCTWKYCWVTRT